MTDELLEIAEAISNAISKGGKLMICGNGGSASQAQHMAGEFICKFNKIRRPLPAIALTTDTSVLTSISNDYGYQYVFSRQIEALGKPTDVLLTLTTSGKSKNILEAEAKAEEMGILFVRLPNVGTTTPEIQENHLRMIHQICDLVEQKLC